MPAGLSPAIVPVFLACLIALPWISEGYFLFQIALTMSYAIILLGLNLLTGYSGQLSLGHGRFVQSAPTLRRSVSCRLVSRTG